jgi:hypothetical protein
MAGHAQTNDILEFDLPPMGSGSGGTDFANYPRVNPSRTIPGWWPASEGYAMGLAFFDNKLWVAPRVFYDMSPSPVTRIYAMGGEVRTINVPRQQFSGFMKIAPGVTPLLGGGGYESGQGSTSGPSLATMSGQKLIGYGWPGVPGPLDANGVPIYWNQRAPRPANYYPVGHVDSWVAWEPRVINGVLEGRWASDLIHGGGLVLPEGITYWPTLGIGELDYACQCGSFAWNGNSIYEYRYDSSTYQFKSYSPFPFQNKFYGIAGQEIDSQGRIYLSMGSAWASGLHKADPVILVYSP